MVFIIINIISLSLPSSSSSLFWFKVGDRRLPFGLQWVGGSDWVILHKYYQDYHHDFDDYDDFGDGMRIVIVKLMFRKFAHYLVYSDDAMVRLKQIFFSGSV